MCISMIEEEKLTKYIHIIFNWCPAETDDFDP